MKKLIFILIIGSIITAQPQTLNSPFSQNQIPTGQDIQNMLYDQTMNQSNNSLYSQAGRPTITNEQIWNGSAWVNDTRMEYEYALAKTKDGNFIDILFIFRFAWNGAMWAASGDETWNYDGQGNLIEILTRDHNGNALGRRIYEGPFTANGDAAVITDQWDNNGVWTDQMRYTYTYDANGCIIDEVWESSNGSAWVYYLRVQKYYSQACCPERWVFSYWGGNAWLIYYMASFTYASCMTDIVPFSYAYSYWWYLYLCNPTLVLMGPTSDGNTMLSVESREEYTYTNCLAMTYIMYSYVLSATFQMRQTNYTYGQYTGKVSTTYDNSDQRLISQVTQVDGVNSTKTLHAYEGFDPFNLPTESDTGLPIDFSLNQNYPNPFNPSTTITFDLSEDSDVKISIYDMTGRMIRELVNQTMTVGSKTINWDGKDESGNPVSGGIYLYNLQTGDYSQTKKMVLMK